MKSPREVLINLANEVDAEFARRRSQAFVTWSWVEHAAARVWASPDSEQRREAVVGLLCAVGNFKRQTPISLGSQAREVTSPQRSTSLELPGILETPVIVDEHPQSVRVLTRGDGIGTATATAVLSALFPENHAIMDVRSAPVAAAWARALAVAAPGPHHDDSRPAVVSDDDYAGWYHGVVHSLALEAVVGVRAIERVCFLARVNTSGYESWDDFADALVTKGRDGWSRGL
ncbi:hypothetical protein [Egicoccus sp. AB-alg6-2]|uniref:hypothetical protein n=1 Tax=Egicoccus sp. AB-alg6-2 TaxID=3242692 RepID=UPI00359DF0F2